jgi:hypothetical protein
MRPGLGKIEYYISVFTVSPGGGGDEFLAFETGV